MVISQRSYEDGSIGPLGTGSIVSGKAPQQYNQQSFGYSQPFLPEGSSTTSGSGLSFLPTHRRHEESTLPTNRQRYLNQHPVTRMADLHSNEKMIAPLWTKVSKTAWEDKARLCSGYGVRMEKTKISIDAPKDFVDPHRSAQEFYRKSGKVPEPVLSLSQMSKKPGTCCTEKPDPYLSSLVLPGGSNLYQISQRAKEEGYSSKSGRRRFAHGKQTYLDYPKPLRNNFDGPIRWDSESARQRIQHSDR